MFSNLNTHLRTVELWQGPDNTPQQLNVYTEDGKLRPIVCFMNTPFGRNSISIRNTAQLEYPLQAVLDPTKLPNSDQDAALAIKMDRLSNANPKLVQGGAVWTVPIPYHTNSLQLLLQTQGRPMSARIELLSGPNNVKQVMELYSEDGQLRPFYSIIQTPNIGNVIRIVNTATIEFPLTAVVAGWDVDEVEENGVSLGRRRGANAHTNDSNNDKPLFELAGNKKWGANFYEEYRKI
jgi:hypothetical protein